MKTPELDSFIERENVFRKLMARTLISHPLTEGEFRYLLESIDGALSPENLSCDGELSRAETNKKYRFLLKARMQLESFDEWGLMECGDELL